MTSPVFEPTRIRSISRTAYVVQDIQACEISRTAYAVQYIEACVSQRKRSDFWKSAAVWHPRLQ